MKIQITLLFIISLIAFQESDAQQVKFGKVSKEELEEKFYPQDTSANAVILYKKHRTSYEFNRATGLTLRTEVHTRIKLYNKNGFYSATKKIKYYTNRSHDESISLKANTYNLEGGEIVKTKLDKKDIFKEDITEHWKSKNFTMPNLKDGSVIEWKYTKLSPYIWNIGDVICQYKIPIKELDAKIRIPDAIKVNHYPSIYYPVNVKKSQIYRNSIRENVYTINMKNTPAMKVEDYIDNIDNYRGKVTFEISAFVPKGGIHEYFNTSWDDVTKTIYESSSFGGQLDKSSHFKDDLASITNGKTSQDEKIIAIYNFVKAKIKWNENYGISTSSDGIKKAYKEGVGNVAEINLTLVAMLREAGINANPILVSTRDHGIPLFPTIDGFNYVIAGVENNNDVVLLDATEKYSSPNILPLRALNWQGRIIREHGSSTTVDLYPKFYSSKNIKLSAKLDEEGAISGMMNTTYSNLRALKYRDNYNSLSKEELIGKIEENNGAIEIQNIKVNNKDESSKPIVENVQYSKDDNADIIGDKIYLNPLLFLTSKENPFKQEERLYPIDFGSAWKNDFTISIQIPEGYTIESVPENTAFSMTEGLGSFAMIIEVKNNKINVKSQTKINRAKLGPNFYHDLKELYKSAIEKQQEKIVLVRASQP